MNSRLDQLTRDARAADHIALHIDGGGACTASFGGVRFALHTGDEIEAVTKVIIERLHDPDAPEALPSSSEVRDGKASKTEQRRAPAPAHCRDPEDSHG